MESRPAVIPAEYKASLYAALCDQLFPLLHDEKHPVAACATVASALSEAFEHASPGLVNWIGFYIVTASAKTGDDPLKAWRVAKDESNAELVVGPFMGKVACLRIKRGRGVCGTAWAQKRTIVVPDVDAFPGHIACDSHSKSEIVVPIMIPFLPADDSSGAGSVALDNESRRVVAVLDGDARTVSAWDEVDKTWLEKIAAMLANCEWFRVL
eukprot:ANDGO_03069.mRNA.1 GAF domain-containing protein A